MKKRVSVMLSVLLVMSSILSFTSFAFDAKVLEMAERPIASSYASLYSKEELVQIYEVFAKVNKQYGTDFRLPTEDDVKASNNAGTSILPTAKVVIDDKVLKQLEDELAVTAKFLMEDRAISEQERADAAQRNAVVSQDLASEGLVVTAESADLRMPKSGYKRVVGANLFFEGWANNYSSNFGYGGWTWEYLNKATFPVA